MLGGQQAIKGAVPSWSSTTAPSADQNPAPHPEPVTTVAWSLSANTCAETGGALALLVRALCRTQTHSTYTFSFRKHSESQG